MIASTEKVRSSPHLIRLKSNPSREYRRTLVVQVNLALGLGCRRVVIDCSAWKQLDLIVLSALVCCARTCEEHRVEFELENLPNEMRGRIIALSLADRLGIHV